MADAVRGATLHLEEAGRVHFTAQVDREPQGVTHEYKVCEDARSAEQRVPLAGHDLVLAKALEN